MSAIKDRVRVVTESGSNYLFEGDGKRLVETDSRALASLELRDMGVSFFSRFPPRDGDGCMVFVTKDPSGRESMISTSPVKTVTREPTPKPTPKVDELVAFWYVDGAGIKAWTAQVLAVTDPEAEHLDLMVASGPRNGELVSDVPKRGGHAVVADCWDHRGDWAQAEEVRETMLEAGKRIAERKYSGQSVEDYLAEVKEQEEGE
jgi:hypothetical protein